MRQSYLYRNCLTVFITSSSSTSSSPSFVGDVEGRNFPRILVCNCTSDVVAMQITNSDIRVNTAPRYKKTHKNKAWYKGLYCILLYIHVIKCNLLYCKFQVTFKQTNESFSLDRGAGKFFSYFFIKNHKMVQKIYHKYLL